MDLPSRTILEDAVAEPMVVTTACSDRVVSIRQGHQAEWNGCQQVPTELTPSRSNRYIMSVDNKRLDTSAKVDVT